MHTTAPVLETERLILRAHRVDDFDAIATQWADPDVVKYIGGTPSSREASWSRLLRYPGHWQMMGFGYWAIFLKDGTFVGEIGLADYQREISPSLVGMAEMGWVISPVFHGKGYAFEAARRVLEWADANLDRQLCCIIEPNHSASVRLAEKCGFVAQSDALYHGAVTRIFKRTGPRF